MKIKPHPQLTPKQNRQIQRFADEWSHLHQVNPDMARNVEQLITLFYNITIKDNPRARRTPRKRGRSS